MLNNGLVFFSDIYPRQTSEISNSVESRGIHTNTKHRRALNTVMDLFFRLRVTELRSLRSIDIWKNILADIVALVRLRAISRSHNVYKCDKGRRLGRPFHSGAHTNEKVEDFDDGDEHADDYRNHTYIHFSLCSAVSLSNDFPALSLLYFTVTAQHSDNSISTHTLPSSLRARITNTSNRPIFSPTDSAQLSSAQTGLSGKSPVAAAMTLEGGYLRHRSLS